MNAQSVASSICWQARIKKLFRRSTHRHAATDTRGQGVYVMDISNQRSEKGNHISGVDKGKIVMYGLSTCVWCKRTKKLLTDLGVEYDYVFVDKLDKAEENET